MLITYPIIFVAGVVVGFLAVPVYISRLRQRPTPRRLALLRDVRSALDVARDAARTAGLHPLVARLEVLRAADPMAILSTMASAEAFASEIQAAAGAAVLEPLEAALSYARTIVLTFTFPEPTPAPARGSYAGGPPNVSGR